MSQNWIDEYTDWAMKRSPLTPRHFHQNIALALIAGATAGRCYVQLPHEKVFPNIYTLVIATTSVYAKTTAFNIAQEIIDLTFPEKVLYGVLTPEAMMMELSGKKPSNYSDLEKCEQLKWDASSIWGARRLFIADEAGRFFNSLKRDYNTGLDALMMELYDASGKPISRNTMKNGWVHINQPALSCLFGTTPSNVRGLLAGPDAWASGFWIRWSFVTETEPTPWIEGEMITPPLSLVKSIKNVSCNWLTKYHMVKPYSIPIDMAVKKQYNESTRIIRDEILKSDDERMHGALARLPTKHLKAAILFSIIESEGERPHLQLSHWEQAYTIAQRWQSDAMTVVKIASHTERMNLEEKIMHTIESYAANGVSSRYLQQRYGCSAQEMRSVLDVFEKDHSIFFKTVGKKILWFPCEPQNRTKVHV